MRHVKAGVVLAAALALAGCRGNAPSTTPAPAGSPSPAATRIGVVDLQAVARAHPRWPQLDALNKKIERAQLELASPPPLPPVPAQRNLQARLDRQARQIEAEFKRELAALKARQEERLRQYVAGVRVEQEAKLARSAAIIEAELKAALEARARAAQEELAQFELEILEEYRYPMANLRLKADVVGVTNEEELRRLTDELDRLQTERNERTRKKAEAIDAALREFQKVKEAEAKARLDRARKNAEAETRRLAAAKTKELQAEGDRITQERQRQFTSRIAAIRRQLLGTAQTQLQRAQAAYVESLRKRQQQIAVEQRTLQEQRARLEDSILAEVKIEVATLAASQGLDVVLTRYQVSLAGVDLTSQLIAKLKRP